MGNALILFLIAVSAGGLAACREQPPAPAGTSAAPAMLQGAVASRWVELKPSNEALTALLAEHAQRAAEQKLAPVLYVGASWCMPCKVLEEHRGDPRVVHALRGTYILHIDFDDWNVADLRTSGYELQAVPVLFAIGADGKASGPKLDGDAWGGAGVEKIAVAFEGFFHQP